MCFRHLQRLRRFAILVRGRSCAKSGKKAISGCFLADCNRFGPRRCWSMHGVVPSVRPPLKCDRVQKRRVCVLNPESASWGSNESPGNWADRLRVCTNTSASAGTDRPCRTSAAREAADVCSYRRLTSGTTDRNSPTPVPRSDRRTARPRSASTPPKLSRRMTKRRIGSFVFPM